MKTLALAFSPVKS